MPDPEAIVAQLLTAMPAHPAEARLFLLGAVQQIIADARAAGMERAAEMCDAEIDKNVAHANAADGATEDELYHAALCFQFRQLAAAIRAARD